MLRLRPFLGHGRTGHCERSEAIHRATKRKNGLLRHFPLRNDVARFGLFHRLTPPIAAPEICCRSPARTCRISLFHYKSCYLYMYNLRKQVYRWRLIKGRGNQWLQKQSL